VRREGSGIAGFLADTWWFGLSKRLSAREFADLAALRAEQGFSAVQLVVGIPPEVGPENENACSEVGFPWTLDGHFNQEYLDLARKRTRHLNNLGFIVIVYGAWGHQIEWLGRERMAGWWLRIVDALDDCHVVYCLCGESNLWVGEASKLLLDKSTDDLVTSQLLPLWFPSSIKGRLSRAAGHLTRRLRGRQIERRRDAWSFVLESVSQKTSKPIVVHPTAFETGYEAVTNPELLAANTAQTGHDAGARNCLWQLPLASLKDDRTRRGFINLEPWYEGIRDQFGAADQMYAYWASMLAGTMSYCYGAHGIWNVGDGKFLAHWGKQTFAQALALDTPGLLGRSHKQFLRWNDEGAEVFYRTEGKDLITIGRKRGEKLIQFFPDIPTADDLPVGKIWLPIEGRYSETYPAKGQVVVFRD